MTAPTGPARRWLRPLSSPARAEVRLVGGRQALRGRRRLTVRGATTAPRSGMRRVHRVRRAGAGIGPPAVQGVRASRTGARQAQSVHAAAAVGAGPDGTRHRRGRWHRVVEAVLIRSVLLVARAERGQRRGLLERRYCGLPLCRPSPPFDQRRPGADPVEDVESTPGSRRARSRGPSAVLPVPPPDGVIRCPAPLAASAPRAGICHMNDPFAQSPLATLPATAASPTPAAATPVDQRRVAHTVYMEPTPTRAAHGAEPVEPVGKSTIS